MRQLFCKISFIVICIFILFGATSYNNAYNYSHKAWEYAYAKGITNETIYIYVDFTKPSTEKRFYIVKDNRIIYSTWVAHGVNSGKDIYSFKFSNDYGSYKSSIGVYRVVKHFYGKHGLAVKIEGLEYINSHAYNRAIEIHRAKYIGHGRHGHSLGCFAIPEDAIKTILKYAEHGTILIAYYPDKEWLNTSRFLNA